MAPVYPIQTLPGVKPGHAIRGLSAGIGEGAGPSIERYLEPQDPFQSWDLILFSSSGKSDAREQHRQNIMHGWFLSAIWKHRTMIAAAVL